jgi:hypothetical protein
VLPKGRKEITLDRWFNLDTIGIVSAGDDLEFAVVQLACKFVDIPDSSQKMGAESYAFTSQLAWRVNGKMGAELCVFRSSSSKSSDDQDDGVVAQGNWEILTLPIQYRDEELSDLLGWSTDGAITFNESICWFDYNRGGIMVYTPPPLGAEAAGGESSISYIRLPIDQRHRNSLRSRYPLNKYRSLCVTGQRGNEQLKFVDVARSDGEYFGKLRYGYYTITCHSFTPTDDQLWHKDVVITSEELRRLDKHTCLMPPREVPTFPLVSRDEPHLVHFLVSEAEPRDKNEKSSVVVIDIITRTVVTVFPYIQGDEDLLGKDADMIEFRRRLPWSFLPAAF